MQHKKPLRSKLFAIASHRSTSTTVAVFVVLAAAGSIFWIVSHAASYVVSAEAESGAITGNAAAISVAGTSGGSAVKFGSSATTVSCDQAGIQKMVDSVSAANLEANLRSLVQDDSKPTPNELISRHVSSPGNKIKVDWMKQKLTGYGLQNVDQPFTSGGRNLSNVIGRLTGTSANTLYATGAHIDSISPQAGTLAPGAEDDGSGIVAVMETARVLKGFQPCMKTSVDFIGFNDEEEDFGGNATYIKKLSGMTFKGLFNIDMIGWTPNGECMKNYYNNAARDQPLADRLASVNTKYGINLPMSAARYTANDQDAGPFWAANLPAIYENKCVSDNDYPGYHKTTDNVRYVNFAHVTKLTKAVVAALAELSSQ